MNKIKIILLLLITTFSVIAENGLTGDVEKLKSNTEMHIIELYAHSIPINKTNANPFWLYPHLTKGVVIGWELKNKNLNPPKTGVYRYYIQAVRDSHDANKDRSEVRIYLSSNNKDLAILTINGSTNIPARDFASTQGYLTLKKGQDLKIKVTMDRQDSKQKLLRDIKISLEYLGE